MPKNAKFKIILLFALFFSVTINSLQAEPANNNIVIAAGETWGTYTPPNYDYAWPYIGEINESMADVEFGDVNACLFKTDRYASSYYFGNPGWSWMSGKVVYDFTNFLFAIEYSPSDEFATANMLNEGMRYEEKNYAYLTFNHSVPGWDDPSRNYHIPADGGAVLTDDRTLAYGAAAWPTQLGVDVKMTVYSWTTNWNHLDDFHLIEFELKNTGMADMNGDGTIDLTENKIENLVFGYNPGCFHFRIVSDGSRTYYVDNTNFRGAGYDMTPDETGSPMHISFQAIGSQEGTEHLPSLSLQNEYWDGYAGYGFLGAKTLKDDAWQEKFLSFKDIHGNQIVPSVGEGSQRGWFSTNQTGFNLVNSGTADRRHTAYMGAFYKDGGKSNDVAMSDLSPNPNLFSSGEFGNPSTFVVKDPSEWQYPDGAREKLMPVMFIDKNGAPLGINPMDPSANKNRPLEPGIITEGFITQYEFDATPVVGFGPISIDVGETVRVYFVRGSGFRIEGLRKTFKAARAVFKSIGPDGDVTANVPAGPPVPEIKVNVNESVNPLIKWQDPTTLGDCDGIKIYRCVSLPTYDSIYDLYPTHDTWWKTMEPNNEHIPKPYNPLFTRFDIHRDQQGDSWGPYHLVKVISLNEFTNYSNPDDDAEEYPYAWEDDTIISAGQSCWYYMSSYKEGAATTVPEIFKGIEDWDINWMESGKVNYNGRSGRWESTWPWTWQHSYYPDENDTQALKNLGAAIILKSNHPEDAAIRISTNSLDFGEARIGDLVKHPDELVIRNAGIADLKIDSIAVPPGFTINKYPRNFPIALTPLPRENNKTEINLIVRFKPLKESDFSGDLIVYHSDNDTTVLTVHLSAKQKETQNTIYESQKWHQFGLAGRSCLLEGNVQNADTLYVSTIEESGYFASYNGGSTWNFQQITRPDSAEIYFNRSLQDASHQLAEKLFFDTINHGCLYYEYIYSTPEKLINKTFRSDDNGITWSQIFKDHENASNIYIYEKIQILVDPNDAQKVYRCLDGSVAVSEDKGNNWAELNPGINGYTLVIDPTNSNNLYYFNPSDIAKSTNSGQSWQITRNYFGSLFQLAIDPVNSNTLYGFFQDFSTNTYGMYKSFDAGSSWSRINNGIDTEIFPSSPLYPHAIVINRQNNNQIFMGTGSTVYEELAGKVYFTYNGGQTWDQLDNGWNKYSPHIENIFVKNLWLANRNGSFTLYAATNDGIYKYEESAVNVDGPAANSMPKNFELMQNYPNPFNPTTCINYNVPRPEHVKISIFNMLGQEIITLVDGKKSAGNYTLHWNGRNKNNDLVSNGIYICKMTSGNFVQNIKMIVLK